MLHYCSSPINNTLKLYSEEHEFKRRLFGAYCTTNEQDNILVSNMVSTIEKEMTLCPDTPNYIRNRTCMYNFVLNMIHAIQIDEEVLYRRDTHFYNGNYHPSLCSSVISYADILITLGFVTGYRGDRPKDGVSPGNRKMSSLRPTQKFFDMLADGSEELIANIKLSRDPTPIQLTLKEKVKIYYIDEKTGKERYKSIDKYTPLPIDKKEYQIYHTIGDNKIRYKLTIAALEKEVRAYNNCLLSHNITFPEGAFGSNEQDKLTWHYSKNCKVYTRKFTNNMSRGGRYYSHGTQNISGPSRRNMLIDGSPVVECDYSALHASIIYNSLGIPIPDGDLYTVSGFEEWRGLCKVGLLIMLNAKNEVDGRKAIREHVYEEGLGISHDDLTILVNSFIEKHRAIAHMFFKDKGAAMQSLDSRIMSYIIKDFVKRDKPLLCYHDSCICKTGDQKYLIELMQKYYKNVIKVESFPNIDVKYGTLEHVKSETAFNFRSSKRKFPALRTGDGVHEILDWDDKSLDIVNSICFSRQSSKYMEGGSYLNNKGEAEDNG